METEALVSPCPYCTFVLGFTNRKAQIYKQVDYVTKIIGQSLES